MSANKKSNVVLNTAFLYLAHALIVAMTRVNGDPKYALYRHGKCMKKPVENPLTNSSVDISNGGGLEEIQQLQEYISNYKIVVFDDLNMDRKMSSRNSLSDKKLYLLYIAGTRHYNVITNLEAAMA